MLLYFCSAYALNRGGFVAGRRRDAYEVSLPSMARSVVTNSVAERIAVEPYITLLFWPVPAAPPVLVLLAHSCRLPYSLWTVNLRSGMAGL